jgi:hypothetical protein
MAAMKNKVWAGCYHAISVAQPGLPDKMDENGSFIDAF